MSLAIGMRALIRHEDRQNIARAERGCRQHGRDRRVDAAGETDETACQAGFVYFVANKSREDLAQELRVGGNPNHPLRAFAAWPWAF